MDVNRQCKAKSKQSGRRCRNAAIAGGTVCRMHGGGARQVKRKAALRELEAVKAMIDPKRILEELATVAGVNVADLYDKQGNLLPVHKLPRHVTAAISSIEVVKKNLEAGDGKVDTIHKVRLWDKLKALEALAKHFGLLVEKVEHQGEINIKWQE